MGTNIDNFEKYIGVFEILSKCTDDYLFILDFIEDHYNITKRATEIFNFEQNDFYNALSIIGESVYPDDREMLNNNIQDIIDGKSNEHDLEYRWINKSGNPVWISCRGISIIRRLPCQRPYIRKAGK